ncbi:MAG: DNA mismatch repair protein MutS, partial [Myxococcota bacterium]
MGISEATEDSAQLVYTDRLKARQAEAERRARRASIMSNLRLVVFFSGVLIAWLVFGTRSLAAGWLAPPAITFAALLVVHDRLLVRKDRALRSVAFYQRGLDRLNDGWAGGGERGERFRDSQHPYAEDLDLFGKGSLFELLCTARTRAGEDRLAQWLQAPAPPAVIRSRQEAVAELSDGVDLREDLARLGDEVRAGLHPEALSHWGNAPATLASPVLAAAAAVVAGLTILGLVAWIATPIGPLPFGIALLLGTGFAMTVSRRVSALIGAMQAPARDLSLFSHLLARLESQSYSCALLVALRSELDTAGTPPSKQIARLRLLVDLIDASRNQLFIPIAWMLLWKLQLACAIDRWRVSYGPALSRWIDAVGEFEALSALASFGYEHPDFSFPEIVEGAVHFEGTALGHPLLPADRCVRNDLSLVSPLQLLIVSGSNMSGKSTLLRTVGSNTVLALAGAPVCAKSLRLTPLSIGASIRIQDSLQEGSSRFYAEILRLRQITELAREQGPALFLLDEILHGTNS